MTGEDGVLLAGVRITVTGSGAVGLHETRTDDAGFYQFMALPTLETLEIRAEAPGRIPLTYWGLSVDEDHTTRRDFKLRPRGRHEVLVVLDARVPYHGIALGGARSTLPGSLTVLEMTGEPRQDERRLRLSMSARPNAVLAIGAKAARLARRVVRDAPVVHAMVPDPAAEELDAVNLCGVSLNGGFSEQLQVLASLKPGLRRLVTVYDPRRLDAAVGRLRKLAADRGMQLSAYPARHAGQVISALESLRGETFDAFFFLLDPDLFDIGGFERVRRYASERSMIFVVPDASFVATGGTFSYSPGFHEMGAHAGRMVAHIFSGAAEPHDLKLTFPPDLRLSVNPVEVERLGLAIPQNWPSPLPRGPAAGAPSPAAIRPE